MSIEITDMSSEDYDEVAALWRGIEGIGLDDDTDSRENTANYLRHNPGLSFVARHNTRIVGAVLCGHDGRRGYLHHLAVHPSYRNHGIARAMVHKCAAALASVGIRKCNIFVFEDNHSALAFWERVGWAQRPDIVFLQRPTDALDTQPPLDA